MATKAKKKVSKPKKLMNKAVKLAKKIKVPAKVMNYLEKAGVKHDLLEHKTVYTAYDAAQTMGKKLGEIAKSLLVKADKDYFMVLLPADQNLDLDKLKKHISLIQDKEVKVVKIPGEKIMKEAFKLKDEALSAFGTLHDDLPVIMDKTMEKAKKAVFASGSFNHSVEMAVKDFAKLENAFWGKFGVKKKVKLQKAAKTKAKKKK